MKEVINIANLKDSNSDICRPTPETKENHGVNDPSK